MAMLALIAAASLSAVAAGSLNPTDAEAIRLFDQACKGGSVALHRKSAKERAEDRKKKKKRK